MKCKNCGQEYESMFCPNCGLVNPDYKTCKNCGKDYKGDFCPYCGTPSEDFYICKECGTPYKSNYCPNCGIVKDDGNVTIPKKKKQTKVPTIAIILLAVSAVIIWSCVFAKIKNSGDPISDIDIKPNQQQTTTPTKPKEEDIKSQLEVKEYLCNKSDVGNNDNAYLEIKNNSNYDLYISANLCFYDKDGNIIDTGNASEPACAKGQTILLQFHTQERFASVSYDITTRKSYLNCIYNDLSYTVERTTNKKGNHKEIITLTNNSDSVNILGNILGTALFFKDGECVGDDTIIFHDAEQGRTITETAELLFGERDYDDCKIYFSNAYGIN